MQQVIALIRRLQTDVNFRLCSRSPVVSSEGGEGQVEGGEDGAHGAGVGHQQQDGHGGVGDHSHGGDQEGGHQQPRPAVPQDGVDGQEVGDGGQGGEGGAGAGVELLAGDVEGGGGGDDGQHGEGDPV